MPNKITTQQLFDQYVAMNQKLDALDQKINGIIDGSTPANTQLTGSYEEYEFPVRDIPAQSSTNYYIDVVDVFGTMNNIGVALYAANHTGAKVIVTVYSMPKNSLNSVSLGRISEVIYDSNIARDNQYPGQAPITNIAPKYNIVVTAGNDDLESFKLVVYAFKGA